MKRTVVCIALAAAAVLAGTKTIGGNVQGIVFDEAAGPFVVERDIVVPAGARVVMQAGTVLLFKPFTGLRVDGELVVEGSAEKPVVFTSVHDSRYGPSTGQLPNAFDWNGVLIGPQSAGVRLNTLHLMYSVYGIKSQTDNVQLRNCVFDQNGQFHFTINDKIQYVQDRIPFSNVAGAGPQPPAARPQSRNAPDNWAPKKEKAPRGTRIFRYTCLGAGLAAGGVAAYCGVRASQAADAREEAERSGGAAAWDKAQHDYESAIIGTAVSGALAGVLLLGFGITFFF